MHTLQSPRQQRRGLVCALWGALVLGLTLASAAHAGMGGGGGSSAGAAAAGAGGAAGGGTVNREKPNQAAALPPGPRSGQHGSKAHRHVRRSARAR